MAGAGGNIRLCALLGRKPTLSWPKNAIFAPNFLAYRLWNWIFVLILSWARKEASLILALICFSRFKSLLATSKTNILWFSRHRLWRRSKFTLCRRSIVSPRPHTIWRLRHDIIVESFYGRAKELESLRFRLPLKGAVLSVVILARPRGSILIRVTFEDIHHAASLCGWFCRCCNRRVPSLISRLFLLNRFLSQSQASLCVCSWNTRSESGTLFLLVYWHWRFDGGLIVARARKCSLLLPLNCQEFARLFCRWHPFCWSSLLGRYDDSFVVSRTHFLLLFSCQHLFCILLAN